MIRSILVPIDGSVFAEHALPLAMALARRSSAALHLVQVHVPVLAIESLNLLDDALDADLRQREAAYLEALAGRVRQRVNVPVRTAMPSGHVPDVLVAEARRSQSDLIVMTTHGRGPLSRFWLGSVAEEIVRRGPAPVLLRRPPEGPVDLAVVPTLRRILVPLDGSAAAERVLPEAVAIAGAMSAEFTLLQAVLPIPVLGYDLGGYAAAGTDIAIIERQQADARSYLLRVKDWLEARGFRVSARVALGAPAPTAILDEAQASTYDLIALHTHARTGLARLLLGSVADKVVRGATCAVLVHRGPYQADQPAAPASTAQNAGVGILP
jgi:nucleotide-binding universal stress UspA family protein